MNRLGMRRGLRGLVMVGAIGGLLTVGLATQASATAPATPPRSVGGSSLSVNPNKAIETPVRAVAAGETVVVSVATGTFAGGVGCSDDAGGNTYTVAADKNTGNGRLFVCTSKLVTPLTGGVNKVSATYPSFSGTSVISVVAVPNSAYSGPSNTGSGTNPPVTTFPGIAVAGPHWLVGVVANSNVSSFVADAPWTAIPVPVSGGTGAGKRTLTPVYQWVFGPLTTYNVTGHLTGSGSWQAAILALQNGIV